VGITSFQRLLIPGTSAFFLQARAVRSIAASPHPQEPTITLGAEYGDRRTATTTPRRRPRGSFTQRQYNRQWDGRLSAGAGSNRVQEFSTRADFEWRIRRTRPSTCRRFQSLRTLTFNVDCGTTIGMRSSSFRGCGATPTPRGARFLAGENNERQSRSHVPAGGTVLGRDGGSLDSGVTGGSASRFVPAIRLPLAARGFRLWRPLGATASCARAWGMYNLQLPG